MAIAETVRHYLDQHSVEYNLIPHPHTGSSHETSEAAHVDEDHMAKGVLLKDEAGYGLVVIPAGNWVEMEHLRKELDRELHLATEPEIEKLFHDCDTGAVPPLGPAYGIETFVDDALASLADIYFESGDHENLVHVKAAEFNRLLSGARHGYFSHE